MELVKAVYTAVAGYLPRLGKVKRTAAEIWATLVPTKIGTVDLPTARANWKALLAEAIDDVLNAIEDDQKVVLIWDELPLMLHNLTKREGADTAIQLLDLLRSLRHKHSRLRFLFTGSIGLHLVLKALRAAGNANDPTNDMQRETVPPMEAAEATELAARLLLALPFPPLAVRPLADDLVRLVEGFPYYLHHTVDRLRALDRSPTAADLAAAATALVFADEDPAHLAYYDHRLATYYDPADAHLARLVLNAVAFHGRAMPLEQVCNAVRHNAPDATDHQLHEVCRLLRQDHYLTLHAADPAPPLYDFRWGIVRRWWKANHE
jgi:hypothetical protein